MSSEKPPAHQLLNQFFRWKAVLWLLAILVIFGLALSNSINPVQGGQETPEAPIFELGEPPLIPIKTGSESQATLPVLPLVNYDEFAYLPAIFRAKPGFSVDPAHRQESIDFYRQYYLVPSPNAAWTGDVSACNPGTTSQAFRDAVALRINYYRAMAGVPAHVTLSDEYNRKAQQAALMMSANNDLSHNPPITWKCYTAEGHEAAGNSNLALGGYGLDALEMYMHDSGSGNAVVGHRRWILYPQTQTMGTGDIPGGSGYWSTNDLWVFDSHIWDNRPTTREAYVAWPPPGYVPYTIVFPRWSFSYAGANFDNAIVNMTENSASIPVTRYTPGYGYGENTLVWIRTGLNEGSDWPKPAADTTYVVTISNVVISGSPRQFQYTVIVFDPG